MFKFFFKATNLKKISEYRQLFFPLELCNPLSIFVDNFLLKHESAFLWATTIYSVGSLIYTVRYCRKIFVLTI